MNAEQKPKRSYRRITSRTVAEFKAQEALHGNGSAAIRVIEPTRISPKDRAFRITKKSETQDTSSFIDDKLQQIGQDAINRIGKLVNSTDERIATNNSQYVVDHIRGQATKKSIALTGRLNIQSVID